jgi:hypothetical protein
VAYSGDPEIASYSVAEAFAQALSHREPLRTPDRWIWKSAFRIATGELKDRPVGHGAERKGTTTCPRGSV